MVDDEHAIIDALSRALQREFPGCQVDLAGDASEGKRLLEGNDYDVVVSDLRMPGEDGVRFLSHVREHQPDAVRILLTAFPEKEAAIRSVNEARLDRFLTKPIRLAEFSSVMHSAWDELRRASAEAAAVDAKTQKLKGTIESQRRRHHLASLRRK